MVERIAAAKGTWGTVDWAITAQGRMPAREFFLTLDQKEQDAMTALFGRLAATGRINNVEQFKSLGAVAGGVWEFKKFQTRFIGDFRPGKRFVLAHGLTKKRDKVDPIDIAVARRILGENDAVERGGR